MKKFLLCIPFLSLSLFLWAQADSVQQRFAATITSAELKELVYTLSSDEFEGRETGRRGQKRVATYIADYFRDIGIEAYKGSYFQHFPIAEAPFSEISLNVGDKRFFQGKDYTCTALIPSLQLTSGEIAVCGYGSIANGRDDYTGMDVTQKAVLICMDEPVEKTGMNGTTDKYSFSAISSKVSTAREKGASLAILVYEDFKKYNEAAYLFSKQEFEQFNATSIPYIIVSNEVANALLKGSSYANIYAYRKAMNKGRKSGFVHKVSLEVDINTQKEVTGENIIAYIEGTDLKDELVVITAHYDHLGIHDGAIFYGADDDGSGTAAIMEIAEAFMEARKAGHGPRRSILIMPVSGEEKGLLGSEYYASHPVFPLKSTVANLNIDMIGRTDKSHQGTAEYVYIIGSDKLSTDLHKINESANNTYTALQLDYTYNDPLDPNMFYYRSDHYNFAKNNIPVIFYFTGVHKDYHKPTDTAEKLDYNKTEKIVRLVFHTAWELANRDRRIVVDRSNEFKNLR